MERAEIKKRDITTSDYLISFLLYIKANINGISNYRRAYRNYLHVIVQILRNHYPIEAVVRNSGQVLILDSHPEAYYIASLIINGIQFDLNNDLATIMLTKEDLAPSLVINGAIRNGEVASIFAKNIYDQLPIRGKTVIDVGANIGDSSIYFALKGAKRVIGIEPFPKNYEIARRNVEVNRLSDKITLLFAGCSGRGGNASVDPYYESCANSQLSGSSTSGIKIRLLSLEDILTENNLWEGDDMILKIDCEGCEYDLVLSSSAAVLRRFTFILIEYHYGYRNIQAKLTNLGFTVSRTKPVYHATHKYILGYIFARRT
jgi:FkbM family methyltransferase